MTFTDKLRLAKSITIISGIFCVVVSLLLLLNYWQFTNNKPLDSKTIEALVQQLKSEPNNDELKEEIRSFDLLTRKAYFTGRWQVKTGAFILLFGAIVLATALRFYYNLKSRIEEPVTEVDSELSSRMLAQRWVLISGTVIIALALAASYETVDYLNDYSRPGNHQSAVQDSGNEPVKVVEVGQPVNKNDSVRTSKNIAGNTASNVEQIAAVSPDQKVENNGTTEPVNASKGVTPGASAASLTAAEVDANYNSFRGPWGNGVSVHKNVPVKWDGAAGTNLLWKTRVPKPGYNSPVIWGDKVFLTGGNKDGNEVYCFDRNTGKILWTQKVNNIPGTPAALPKVTKETGLAAPSVTTDGQRVFAIFANGDVICFDMDGNRVWARALGMPDDHYGHASSLITWAGKLFIQFDTNKGGRLLAWDVKTGATVWETKRATNISWASPVLADIGGKKQIILSADPIVAGYDTETGKQLWSVECMMGEVGPSVTVDAGTVYAGNENARMVAIDPVNSKVLWEEDDYLPEVASPVCSNGLVVIATSYGMLVCYDAGTGKELWEKDYGSSFYSSPVITDNRIYALQTNGIMHILELNRVAKEISSPQLGEEAYTTPAFSDGRIYIRGTENLYCFGK